MTRKEFYEASLDKQVEFLNNSKYKMIDMIDGSFISFIKSDDGYVIVFSNLEDTEKGKLLNINSFNGKMDITYEDENGEQIVVNPRFVELVKEVDLFESNEFYGIDMKKVKNELLRRWQDYDEQTLGKRYYEEVDDTRYGFLVIRLMEDLILSIYHLYKIDTLLK